MKKVHEFFCNHIAELEKQLERCELEFTRNILKKKLEEAWEMRLIISENIDWDEEE